ncbi:MAG: hypothetical protein AB9846_02100 [Tenuifilaceae bacterium]
MNRIILILLLLFVYHASYPQRSEDERDRNRIINNKISKSVQWIYKYTQGKVSKNGYISTETKYDKRGNVIEVINYKANGKISSKQVYKYDNNNNRIEYLKYAKTDKEELGLTYKQVFSYDEVGNKKLEVGFDGLAGYRIEYRYLPEYRQKDITKYNSDNTVAEKWEYSYEDKSQIIKVFKPGRNFDHSLEKRADEKENIIEEIRRDQKGKEVNRTTTLYDPSNNLSTIAEYFSGTLSKKLTYKYVNLSQLIEITQVNPDGSTFLYRSYKYDPKNNLIEEKWYDGVPDDYSSKTYKHDSKGNVTEVESYYSDYKYKVLYKYTYEYY